MPGHHQRHHEPRSNPSDPPFTHYSPPLQPLHHTHHTTTPPPPGPPDRHCGGVAPCTTHPSHHLTSLGPSVTSVPSLRPLATALALLSHGQGLGVACGWAQEIADQLTWRPKFAPKSVFWVVLEATSVFSMHQLPNIAPSWAPFGSSLVARNFFRQNSELTCILQYVTPTERNSGSSQRGPCPRHMHRDAESSRWRRTGLRSLLTRTRDWPARGKAPSTPRQEAEEPSNRGRGANCRRI